MTNAPYHPLGGKGHKSRPFWFVDCQFYANEGCRHMGQDYARGMGAPIYAALDGVVIEASRDTDRPAPCGYGTLVVLEHGDKIKTLYAHMSALHAQKGDKVKAGQQIGEMGNTGVGDTHLHFGVLLPDEPDENYVHTVNCMTANGYCVDPESYLLLHYGDKPLYTGLVTAPDGVNVRNGAGTQYAKIGAKLWGENLSILETLDVGNDLWAKLKILEGENEQWVAVRYHGYEFIDLTPLDPDLPVPEPCDCTEKEKAAHDAGYQEGIVYATAAMRETLDELG